LPPPHDESQIAPATGALSTSCAPICVVPAWCAHEPPGGQHEGRQGRQHRGHTADGRQGS
jgi:hypothetical protein